MVMMRPYKQWDFRKKPTEEISLKNKYYQKELQLDASLRLCFVHNLANIKPVIQ